MTDEIVDALWDAFHAALSMAVGAGLYSSGGWPGVIGGVLGASGYWIVKAARLRRDANRDAPT